MRRVIITRIPEPRHLMATGINTLRYAYNLPGIERKQKQDIEAILSVLEWQKEGIRSLLTKCNIVTLTAHGQQPYQLPWEAIETPNLPAIMAAHDLMDETYFGPDPPAPSDPDSRAADDIYLAKCTLGMLCCCECGEPVANILGAIAQVRRSRKDDIVE